MREVAPIKDNLIFRKQTRRVPASSNLEKHDVAAADFETIDGYPYLFTLAWFDEESILSDVIDFEEEGRFTLGDFILWISDRVAQQWRRGGGVKGVTHPYLWFYNLSYDAASIIKCLEDSAIDELLKTCDVVVDAYTHKLVKVVKKGWRLELTPEQKEMDLVSIHYLPRKYLRLKPLGAFRDFTDSKGYDRRMGPVDMFDIAQFYKCSLKKASKIAMKAGDIDTVKLDSVDASRIGEEEYRRENYEEIVRYALVDSEVTLQLAWLKVQEFESQGVRMIMPYSLASVSERNMLDICEVPTINKMVSSGRKKRILQYCWTMYRGGWFETTGCGTSKDVRAFDLTSAYPYVMYWLPDSSKGYWSEGSEENVQLFWAWMDERQPYWLGGAECIVQFPKGLNIYPALVYSSLKSLDCTVTPQAVNGWFSGDEIAEFIEWGAKIFVDRWCCHFPDPSAGYPLRPFIEKWYSIKYREGQQKGTDAFNKAAYSVSKVGLNSSYGKVIQTIKEVLTEEEETDGKRAKLKTSRMFNPAWGMTITGGTRARMAEMIRLNGGCLAVATDGIVIENRAGIEVPDRPLPACYDLGNWEEYTYDNGREGPVDLLVMMSGVYSLVGSNGKVTSKYRGNSSLFIEGEGQPTDWPEFCEINSELSSITRDIDNHPNSRPYTLAEARIRGDYSLVNQFRVVDATIRVIGDSNKRIWLDEVPKTFADLNSKWFKSRPHSRVF